MPALRRRHRSRLHRVRRLRRRRNVHDPRLRLEHTSVPNLLAKLVLVRLVPPRLLPPLVPPLVPLVPKERTCNPKRLVLLLVLNRLLGPLVRLDVHPPLALRHHGGQCLARNLPVSA